MAQHVVDIARFISPVRAADGRITSPWGAIRSGRKHWGVDIGRRNASGASPSIRAAQAGTVVYRGVSGRLGTPPSNGAAGGGSGYGNVIVIYHGTDALGRHIYSAYGHLASFAVALGANVTQGQNIGVMGNTGGSYGIHLHYTIYRSSGTTKLPLPASGTGSLGFYESSVSIDPGLTAALTP
ncbi:M23 family metallopeptidase [Erythrobacter sp. JK5]|uniref:M23 family metallopeptidase n=1 Tax=Erythrobacter sp. JK5 TaxID=2829500 RepID=UPI001BAC2FF8|nr:M23 family metallopeptidase [Erythrobacter sp. JK5]QUL38187.1 M23 family metallopeptidase [Erythrobacter sp. JK5]